MSVRLDSYHIESEAEIILTFSDGSMRTVRAEELAGVLSGQELAKVRESLRIKLRYMRILPPWAKMAVGISLILLAYVSDRAVALYGQSLDPRPASSPTLSDAIVTHSAAAPKTHTAAVQSDRTEQLANSPTGPIESAKPGHHSTHQQGDDPKALAQRPSKGEDNDQKD